MSQGAKGPALQAALSAAESRRQMMEAASAETDGFDHGIIRGAAVKFNDSAALRLRRRALLQWEPGCPSRVLIVKKPRNPAASAKLKEIGDWLQARGMEVFVERVVATTEFKEFSVFDSRDSGQIDMCITLGGDGTVLYMVSLFEEDEPLPPVLCFAMGSLGFLTPFDASAFAATLERVLDTAHHPVYTTLRTRKRCEVVYDGQLESVHHVLNECVVDRGAFPGAVLFEVFVDGSYVTNVEADGLIISTPSGSTAYSLSAGGPVVAPSVPCTVLTPIAPLSLSFRPIVIPESSSICLHLPTCARSHARASFDGKRAMRVRRGTSIFFTTSLSPLPVISLGRNDTDWYEGITQKLKWNQAIRQLPLCPTSAGARQQELCEARRVERSLSVAEAGARAGGAAPAGAADAVRPCSQNPDRACLTGVMPAGAPAGPGGAVGAARRGGVGRRGAGGAEGNGAAAAVGGGGEAAEDAGGDGAGAVSGNILGIAARGSNGAGASGRGTTAGVARQVKQQAGGVARDGSSAASTSTSKRSGGGSKPGPKSVLDWTASYTLDSVVSPQASLEADEWGPDPRSSGASEAGSSWEDARSGAGAGGEGACGAAGGEHGGGQPPCGGDVGGTGCGGMVCEGAAAAGGKDAAASAGGGGGGAEREGLATFANGRVPTSSPAASRGAGAQRQGSKAAGSRAAAGSSRGSSREGLTGAAGAARAPSSQPMRVPRAGGAGALEGGAAPPRGAWRGAGASGSSGGSGGSSKGSPRLPRSGNGPAVDVQAEGSITDSMEDSMDDDDAAAEAVAAEAATAAVADAAAAAVIEAGGTPPGRSVVADALAERARRMAAAVDGGPAAAGHSTPPAAPGVGRTAPCTPRSGPGPKL